MPRELYLVRHGATLSNRLAVYSGRSEEGLIDAGREQAERLGRRASELGVQAIVTSPVRRARQTAEIIAARTGAAVTQDEDLIEIGMGPWKGLSEDRVRERFPTDFRTWNTRPADLRVEGRETLAEVRRRAVRAVESALGSGSEAVMLAVTHVAVIRCLWLHYRGLDLNGYKRVDVPNCSVWRVARTAGQTTIDRVGDPGGASSQAALR